jgi:hypothetical protein
MNGMLEALIVWSLVLSVVWSFLLGPSGIAKICGILIWSDVYIVDSWCIFPFLISSLEYVSIPNLTALLSELRDEVLCWAQISAFVDIRFHRLRELGSLLLILLIYCILRAICHPIQYLSVAPLLLWLMEATMNKRVVNVHICFESKCNMILVVHAFKLETQWKAKN